MVSLIWFFTSSSVGSTLTTGCCLLFPNLFPALRLLALALLRFPPCPGRFCPPPWFGFLAPLHFWFCVHLLCAGFSYRFRLFLFPAALAPPVLLPSFLGSSFFFLGLLN